jgi:NADPH-dependent curcumin reductase CurA
MTSTNRQITLAARPHGLPKESDFQLIESPIPLPGPGKVLVRAHYLSVDPYMRGRMNDRASYAEPVKLGEVMTAGAVGQIVKSNHAKFPEGAYVQGVLGWQEYALSDGSNIHLVSQDLAPLSAYLGVLGMPGLTAYFGLFDVGQPKAGETVLVSGAAGAVGSIAGQIAKINGCRVVGVAGTDEKVKLLCDELRFDAAFNYRSEQNYYAKLKELCPSGIDVYFDNVGGTLTDAVFHRLNVHSRVCICGQISQYNSVEPELGPRLLWKLIETRAKVQGFLVLDYATRFREGVTQLAAWLRSGELQYRETIVQGLENTPRAFLDMLHGKNIGKQLVQIV